MILWLLAVALLLSAASASVFLLVSSRARFDRNLSMWLILALMSAFIIAFIFHPSWSGAILVTSATAGGLVGLSLSLYDSRDVRRFVAAPLLVTTAIQAIVIWGQVATASPWVDLVLEPGRTLLVTGGIIRPHGLMYHVYEPPALALLAVGAAFSVFPPSGKWRLPLTIGIGIASTVIALTHSRAALVGLLLIFAVIAFASFRARRDLRLPLAIMLLAFLLPATLSLNGWTSRLDESLASNLDDASLGRVTLMRQAIDLASEHPVVGVGPNRYLEVLEKEGTIDPRYPWIVHNVPLAIAAELGIPASVAVLLLLVGTGVQAFRAGLPTLSLFLAPLGFYLFDVLHYNRPIGILMFAMWAGLLASRWSAPRPPPSSA